MKHYMTPELKLVSLLSDDILTDSQSLFDIDHPEGSGDSVSYKDLLL